MARLTKSTKKKTISKKRSTYPKVVKESRAEYVAVPEHQMILTEHPHIIRMEGVRGGDPITREASVSVRAIVEITYRLKQTPQEIVDSYSRMTLAQVYDALSYYHDHKEEIDQIIKQNDEGLERARQMTEEMDRQQKHRPPLAASRYARK